MWLNPLCAKCGRPAALPQRIINGKPAPYNAPQVQVGGKETYEPRCYNCHELPGRPMPPY
jgi:thymidine kinase